MDDARRLLPLVPLEEQGQLQPPSTGGHNQAQDRARASEVSVPIIATPPMEAVPRRIILKVNRVTGMD